MLLTDARRPARTTADGELVPLAEQDRRRWDAARDRRGHRAHHRDAGRARRSAPTSCRPRSPPSTPRPRGPRTPTGRRSSRSTSCCALAPGPMVTLNRIVALAMVDGPGRARAAGRAGRRRAGAGRVPPRRTPSARTCWSRRATGGAAASAVPAGGRAHPERARAAIPPRPRGPLAECVLSIRA